MASKQTRRSVSVKGTTHQRIKNYVRDGSVAGFIEKLIEEKLGAPTDEDHRKFGEWLEAREKGPEVVKTIEEPDEQQVHPPEPLLNTKPEEAFVAKVIESVSIPEDAFRNAGPGVAQPEPELKPPPAKRRLAKGSPVEPEESEESGLADYIPPIQFF